jgi:hypothetical protein
MPTLARFGSIAIRMFADDHNPPHFHVVTPDHEAMISIADLRVIAGDIDRRSLDAARAWAFKNQGLLRDEWMRLNAR